MRCVALIYNPASGQHPNGYVAAIEGARAILQEAGVDTQVLPTSGPGTAGELARQAAEAGCDTILACGGDGTAHEILQTLVGTRVALGVVPMGTANALAADLGMASPPSGAVRKLLTAIPVRIPVGRIYFMDLDGVTQSRYFTVAAGVGVDGQFFYRLNAKSKRRFGYLAYFVHAMHLWATHAFPLFEVSIQVPGAAKPRVEAVSQLLAVRIANFGGMVHNLVPEAALRNGNLRLIAFKTRSRVRYLRFITAVWFRRHTYTGAIEALDAVSVECDSSHASSVRILVEADGELLGTVPARIEVVPDALTLLFPGERAR
jgi:YegS/Rv2252/BmrU family lipid kinase